MFLITSGTLGWSFALAKTLSAIGMGLLGGFVTLAFAQTHSLGPLREKPQIGGCCGVKALQGRPVWRFWNERERREVFTSTGLDNVVFLLKWLTLAYVIEALMLRFVPAEWVAGALGGDGLGPIILAAFVGAPAYLNGYAAVPGRCLVATGHDAGAAMSFMIAGGVSCIPAAIAVGALVKLRVFAAYVTYGVLATIAGLIWQGIA